MQIKVHGTIHHLIGPLLPTLAAAATGDVAQQFKFAQLYILDEQKAIEQRCSIATALKPEIITPLTHLLHLHNAYARKYKAIAAQAQLWAPQQNGLDPALEVHAIFNPDGTTNLETRPHARTYNAPRAAEVAGFIPEGHEGCPHRAIVVYEQNGSTRFMKDIDPDFYPLRFPLLFPMGEPGWHPGMTSLTHL